MPLIVDESLKEAIELEVVRPHRLVERVVFVGGHPGCGKSLLSSILGSFARVEMQKYSYILEHLCSLSWLGKLEEDAATVLVSMVVDLDLYYLMQSRETNFRPSDCSSVFQNPGTWRYLRRLFQSGDAATVVRIKQTKPILNLSMCNLLVLSLPLFQALGERMRIVEVIRHPLYMIKQWFLYIERYGTDARDFSIWFECQGQALPFFARGWEERYVASNPMDRVIYSIAQLTELGDRVLEALSEPQKTQLLRIPFEQFVLDPTSHLKQLEALLGTHRTWLTRWELKKQKVPRKMIAEGMPLPIYKTYGWEPPHQGADERRELDRRRQYAAQYATPAAMDVLDRMSAAYEAQHLRGIL